MKIDARVPVARRREKLIRLRKSFFEGADHVAAYFIAAGIRRRPNRGAQIDGARAVLAFHIFDRVHDDRR